MNKRVEEMAGGQNDDEDHCCNKKKKTQIKDERNERAWKSLTKV